MGRTPTSFTAPAGWYPDPWRRHELRFHDGEVWSEHVADAGVAGIDSGPVADLPRSRPPEHRTGPGAPPVAAAAARVLPRRGASDVMAADVLLVDGPRPDAATAGRPGAGAAPEARAVRDATGAPLGVLRVIPPPLPVRVLRRMAVHQDRRPTRLELVDTGERHRLDLRRAHGLTVAVDVRGDGGVPLGRLVAERRISAFEVRIEGPAGPVGRLRGGYGPGAGEPSLDELVVVGLDGRPALRAGTGWQVLATARHPEVGVRLVEVVPGTAQPLRSLGLAAVLAAGDLLWLPRPAAVQG